jgi:twitching motility protein PilT
LFSLIELKVLLDTLVKSGGSDLHLVAGSPPSIRVNGELRRMEHPPLTAEETKQTSFGIAPPDRRAQLQEQGEADFAFSVAGLGRFRVNAFRQRGAYSLAMRRVRIGSASFEALGIPPVVRQLSEQSRGLILVTGPTGSGKTTTLAAMIDHINATRPVHILTIEDPIEVMHPTKLASINQREIGLDTADYAIAMRSAMRQDPDVILIGEMRDSATVAAALQAGETGHLVLSTLHTTDAVETINRVIDFFPSNQDHQVRASLASVLGGVICQRLVPSVQGGRVPVFEVMVNNGRVADRILDRTLTSELRDVIADGEFYGMQTFDQHLLSLVRSGTVSVDRALEVASNPHDIRLMFEQARIEVAS